MFTKKYTYIVFLIVSFMSLSCFGGNMNEEIVTYSSLKEVPKSTWKKLSEKKFYFGHHSVGWNILKGVGEIMKEYPDIKLNVIETTDPQLLKPGVFAHSHVGENTDPQSKINDFVKYINAGIGKNADVATIKFCYVDIRADANPSSIFSEYESQIKTIQETYPNLTIIHFTTPLTTLQTGIKAWTKKLLGRPLKSVRANIKRHEYNEMLRSKYQGKEPILDIANIESTKPDGTRRTYDVEGKTYYSMVPEYTTDGGHLSELGRKKVAEKFLLLLASLK